MQTCRLPSRANLSNVVLCLWWAFIYKFLCFALVIFLKWFDLNATHIYGNRRCTKQIIFISHLLHLSLDTSHMIIIIYHQFCPSQKNLWTIERPIGSNCIVYKLCLRTFLVLAKFFYEDNLALMCDFLLRQQNRFHNLDNIISAHSMPQYTFC